MPVGRNTGPKIAETPLEVLEGTVEEPIWNKHFIPVVAGTMGFIGVCIGNALTKRPVFSGIHIHAGFTLGLAVTGKYFSDLNRNYLAERDAVYRHYIQLHPEDFPRYERKKFGEVLERWQPVR